MKLIVDNSQRKAKMRAHTATHLLHAEICKFLPNTKQLGSLVDEDLVRFDFAAENMLDNNQIVQIEKNINKVIKSDNIINIYEKSIADAKAMGAKAFFEDKYGDIVRVVCIDGENKQKSDQKLHLIFDFDGVLGDSFEECCKSHIGVFESKTYEEAIDWVNNYANNIPFHAKGTVMSQQEEQEVLNNMNLFGKHMSSTQVKLFNIFIKNILHIKNVKLAIVSSGMKSYILPTLGEYDKHFDYIYDYQDSRSKEDKLEMVCKNRGINKSEIYYFTDTLADVYELSNLIDKKQLIGCAWGFSGFDNLSKELPIEQIILTQDGLPEFMNRYIYQNNPKKELNFSNSDNLASQSPENTNNNLISIELCGGTHVRTTSEIGIFKIVSQQSIASGTKRITAYTGPKVMEYIYEQDGLLNDISSKLSCEPKQSSEKLEKVIKDLVLANSQIESFKSGAAANIFWQQVLKSDYTANIYIIKNGDSLTLKDISNYLKGKEGNYIYIDDNSGFVIYSSNKRAKFIQAELGLKGGGNDQMIQGKDESILEKLG